MRPSSLRWAAVLVALAVDGRGAGPLDVIEGVRVEGRRDPGPPGWSQLVVPTPTTVDVAAGRVLLHRRGCTSCHGLDRPTYPHSPGPRLDGVGRKTSSRWLDTWLTDPTGYLPDSRMPRVLLGDRTRARIVDWLSTLGAHVDVPEAPAGDAYRGGRLFEGLRCRGCHVVDGNGGDAGPALDRLGVKTTRDWLFSALRESGPLGLDAGSHPYDLSVPDAANLSAFLVRRFTPPGAEPVTRVTPAAVDSAAARDGLAAAVGAGCFQCHTAGTVRGPGLRLPVDEGRARRWAGYHLQAGVIPAIELTGAEAAAIAVAMTQPAVDPDTAGGPTPPNYWKLPVAPQGDPPELFVAGRRLEPGACGQCHEQQLGQWRSNSWASGAPAGTPAL